MADPDSNLTLVKNAVKSTIEGLSLSGIQGVYFQKQLTSRPKDSLPLPHIIFSTVGGEAMDSFRGWNSSNERTLMVYPFEIIDEEKGNQDYTDGNFNPQTYRREQIRKAFHDKRLSGVSDNMICFIQPEAILIPGTFRSQQLRQSGLRLMVVNRELRD